MIGHILGWICGTTVAVAGGLLLFVIYRHNLRVWRVQRDYKSLPSSVEAKVLKLIHEMAHRCPSVTFLRLDKSHHCDGNDVLLQSHVGGVPYAEQDEKWPSGEPATFLLQMRLNEPTLGQPWLGRLLTVFLIHDFEQVVRSYAVPSFDKYVHLAGHAAKTPPCIALISLRLPADPEPEEGAEAQTSPSSPARLCQLIPAIPSILKPFTKDAAGLLSQILTPNGYGYELGESSIAYQGGDPMLIQNPHDPCCDKCGKPMRFLFQFGDIIPGVQLGDAGVGYVYGCDDHPDHCKGFLDSH